MLGWSQEFPFEKSSISENAPTVAGCYEILQSAEYPRYYGLTRTLKFGESAKSLQGELANHLQRHAAANRLKGISGQPGLSVTFRYMVSTPIKSREIESQLLRDFEVRHWDLPLLNNQRGFPRNEDGFYTNSS